MHSATLPIIVSEHVQREQTNIISDRWTPNDNIFRDAYGDNAQSLPRDSSLMTTSMIETPTKFQENLGSTSISTQLLKEYIASLRDFSTLLRIKQIEEEKNNTTSALCCVPDTHAEFHNKDPDRITPASMTLIRSPKHHNGVNAIVNGIVTDNRKQSGTEIMANTSVLYKASVQETLSDYFLVSPDRTPLLVPDDLSVRNRTLDRKKSVKHFRDNVAQKEWHIGEPTTRSTRSVCRKTPVKNTVDRTRPTSHSDINMKSEIALQLPFTQQICTLYHEDDDSCSTNERLISDRTKFNAAANHDPLISPATDKCETIRFNQPSPTHDASKLKSKLKDAFFKSNATPSAMSLSHPRRYRRSETETFNFPSSLTEEELTSRTMKSQPNDANHITTIRFRNVPATGRVSREYISSPSSKRDGDQSHISGLKKNDKRSSSKTDRTNMAADQVVPHRTHTNSPVLLLANLRKRNSMQSSTGHDSRLLDTTERMRQSVFDDLPIGTRTRPLPYLLQSTHPRWLRDLDRLSSVDRVPAATSTSNYSEARFMINQNNQTNTAANADQTNDTGNPSIYSPLYIRVEPKRPPTSKSTAIPKLKTDAFTQTDMDFDPDDIFSNGINSDCPPLNDRNNSPDMELHFETWPLSLQSIVRPTEIVSSPRFPAQQAIASASVIKDHKHSALGNSNNSDLTPNVGDPNDLSSINPPPSLSRRPQMGHARTASTDMNMMSPSCRLSLSRLRTNKSEHSQQPRCRSVHFSSDVLVAHSGGEEEPLMLFSAPLKEAPHNSDPIYKRPILFHHKQQQHLSNTDHSIVNY